MVLYHETWDLRSVLLRNAGEYHFLLLQSLSGVRVCRQPTEATDLNNKPHKAAPSKL